jgi:hypothetical protein
VAVTILDLTLDLIGDGVHTGKSATEGMGECDSNLRLD